MRRYADGLVGIARLLGSLDRAELKTFGRVGTVGLELALSIAVGFFGGQWLDRAFDTTPVLGWVGLGLGIAAGFKSLFEVRKHLEPPAPPPSSELERDP